MIAMYPDRDRSLNVELVGAVFAAQSPVHGLEAIRRMGRQFHPSLLSEMTYQSRWIVEQKQRPYAEMINQDVFFSTLPENLEFRAHHGDQRFADFPSFSEGYFEKYWASGGHRQGWAAEVLHESAARLSDSWRLRPETDLSRSEEDRVARALRRRATGNVVARAVECALLNAVHRALDDPLTRLPTQVWMRLLDEVTGSAWPRLPPERFAVSPAAMPTWLRDIGQVAEDIGAVDCAATLRRVCQLLSQAEVRPGGTSLDEQIIEGPCGRCGMHFAYEVVVVLDDYSARADFLPPDITFIPEDFNVATCAFCGLRAPVEVPMLYYSSIRNLIVYNAPTYGGMLSRNDAIAHSQEALRRQRASYLEKLADEASARFDAAPEVVALGYREFLSAIHLGDVIKEDHAVTYLRHADGGAAVIDVSKAFVQLLSPEDVEFFFIQELPEDRLPAFDVEESIAQVPRAISFYEARLTADPSDARSRLELANVRLAQALSDDPRLLEILRTRRY